MAAAPTAKVEINFSGSTWTDVTAYWDAKRPITMTGGRADTDERVPPGRLSGLVLDNTDGRFTVGNTSGAYSPNVTSGKKVRVSIKDPASSTYYERFTGRIDGWPLHWEDNGLTCWVTLSATDMLADMLEVDWDRFPNYLYNWGTTECSYWPITDDRASGARAASIGTNPLTTSGAPDDSGESGPPGDPRTFYGKAGTTAVTWSGVVGASSLTCWTAGVMFKSSAPPASQTSILKVTGAAHSVDVQVTTSGYLRLYADTTSYGAATVNICNGDWWWVRVRAPYSTSGNCVVYAENLRDPFNTYTEASFTFTTTAGLTDAAQTRTLAVTAPPGGCIGNVFWAGSSAGTYVVDPRSPSLTIPSCQAWGFDSQYAADWADMCAAIYGVTVTEDATPGTRPRILNDRAPLDTVLAMWQQLDEVDGGITFADRSGDLRHYSGLRRTVPVGTQPTLSLTAADIASEWQVAADSTTLVNEVRLTSMWRGAVYAQWTSSNDGSVNASGRRMLDKTIYGTNNYGGAFPQTDDALLLAPIADEMLSADHPRVPQFAVDVMALTDAQQLAVLGLDLLDQVGVTDLPTAGGFDTKWLGRVEGWSETVAIDQWSITFNTSFAGNVLGDSTHGLILGSNRLA